MGGIVKQLASDRRDRDVSHPRKGHRQKATPLMYCGYSFLLLGAFACVDPRQKAVDQTLEFAQSAPYTIGTPASKYSGFSLLVADSSLARTTTYSNILNPEIRLAQRFTLRFRPSCSGIFR